MKRLLAFVLLLGAGFYLLYHLIGEDMIVTAGSPTQPEEKSRPERSPNRGGSGVGVSQGSFGATVEQRGELSFHNVRDVELPDGTVKKETVFVLHAADSQPLRDGLQQLDDVEVTLFESGEKGAKIFARRALVELGTDANGDPSLAANKEVAMTDVVFEALAGGKLEGLRLELDRARALIDDAELHIYTPSPDDPVRIVFAGERDATLTGKGLQARLPRDRNGALKRVDIDILSEPVLTTPGVVARARGRLHYAEDTANDTGEMSLTDGVELDLDRTAGLSAGGGRAAAGADKMHISADQMLGWLVRASVLDAEGRTSEQMTWRMLQLHGAPARIDLPQLRVSTPQLTILPGPFGMPFWVTASGGVSHIDQIPDPRKAEQGGIEASPIHGSSPRRIHLFRGSELLGATHRAFGFPQWAIAPLEDFHTVAFEGDSHIEDDSRAVDASDGLQVFQTSTTQRGVISRGFGDISLLQQKTEKRDALRAIGNDGYSLVAAAGREVLDLGPKATPGDDRWRDHRYQLEHGELRASGTGTCQLDRAGDRSTVVLRAPDREIEATMVGRSAHLRDVRYLRAEFEGSDVRAFDLAGLPARAVLEQNGESFSATAPRILQTSPFSMRMLPPDLEARPHLWNSLQAEDALPHLRQQAPATDKRGRQSIDARAPRIDLHYMGNNDVLVDARAEGDVPARADATIERLDGGPPITIEFEAGRLRALPFAIPRAVARAHLGGSSGPAASLPFFAELGPWILGENVRTVRVVDPREGSFEGSAQRMIMSTAAQACLLLGDPDAATPARATRTTEGRVVTARGAQVRIFRDDTVRLQAFRTFPGRSTFLLPEVELHQTDRHDVMSHMIATCRGDIEVLPEAVLFHGPVVARSVTADGSTLPDGLGIVAEALTMELHPKTGDVLRVLGRGVDLDWSRVSGRAAEIELDLRGNTMTARDPGGVSVTLANGAVITGERVTVNYHTLAYDIYRGRVDR